MPKLFGGGNFEPKNLKKLYLQTDTNFLYDQFDTGNNAEKNIAIAGIAGCRHRYRL